jgi:hypothetical protein
MNIDKTINCPIHLMFTHINICCETVHTMSINCSLMLGLIFHTRSLVSIVHFTALLQCSLFHFLTQHNNNKIVIVTEISISLKLE